MDSLGPRKDDLVSRGPREDNLVRRLSERSSLEKSAMYTSDRTPARRIPTDGGAKISTSSGYSIMLAVVASVINEKEAAPVNGSSLFLLGDVNRADCGGRD